MTVAIIIVCCGISNLFDYINLFGNARQIDERLSKIDANMVEMKREVDSKLDTPCGKGLIWQGFKAAVFSTDSTP